MTVYFLGQKGFCTYACPYGGFFGSPTRSPGKDPRHRRLQSVRPLHRRLHVERSGPAEVKEYGMVVDPGCMKCMDCVSVCPNDALYFGFGKPAIGVPKTITKNYSLTWPEEDLAAVVFLRELFRRLGRLSARSDADGARHRDVTTFLASEDVEIVPRQGSVFLPFQSEVGREQSEKPDGHF